MDREESKGSSTPRPRRRRWLALAVIALGCAAGFVWWRRPPAAQRPGYRIALRESSAQPGPLAAGFASVDITPDPRERAVWIAGFGSGRRARSVHDPIWARAVVLSDGQRRVGLVALDLIGHSYSDTIALRERVADLGLDYVALCSTHNHEGPDAVGLWGRWPVVSGRDERTMARVRRGAERALREAVAALRPARCTLAQTPSGTEAVHETTEEGNEALVQGWIRDDRPPFVIDPTITALRFDPADGDGAALGSIVIWGNHPEALGPDNDALTSDYPHFVRERMERRLGGVCVFFVGAVGGIMSPLGVQVQLPDGSRTREAGWAKAQAIGEGVADRALAALAAPGARQLDRVALRFAARTVFWPLDNDKFYLAAKLGVLPRGFIEGRMRSEVGVLGIGPLDVLLVPGEIYPELLVGGIEQPEGRDFPELEPEGPPLYERCAAPLQATIGLANDLVGYIIPRTEWDRQPPYNYGAARPWYGETNSSGPAAAPVIHDALLELLERLPVR